MNKKGFFNAESIKASSPITQTFIILLSWDSTTGILAGTNFFGKEQGNVILKAPFFEGDAIRSHSQRIEKTIAFGG
jgi:hypothetical protein